MIAGVYGYANPTYTIKTYGASMEPAIYSGEEVIIEEVNKKQLKEGDIITYSSKGKNIMHRIEKIGNDEAGWFAIVMGDNNNMPDGEFLGYDYNSEELVFGFYKIRFEQIFGRLKN